MASNDPWRIEEEKLPLSAEWKRSRGGNIWPRTLTFLLDTRGNVPNPLANIQRYRLYTERERERGRARLFPPRTDVGRCFDETLPSPGQRGFSFPLCAERQPRPRVRSVERSTTITVRNRAVLARANCRSKGEGGEGEHYRSSSTERILIRFIGDRLRDRPPVKFRCPRTRSRTRLRCARSTHVRSSIEIDQLVSPFNETGRHPPNHRETDSRSPL